MLSAHTTVAELADRRVVALDIEGLPITCHWFVVRHSEKRLQPAARALWQFLAEQGADYLPRCPGLSRFLAGEFSSIGKGTYASYSATKDLQLV